MKKAYTITIESGSKVGKAVIMAKSYKDALSQARQACPKGFKVFDVQKKSTFGTIGGPGFIKSSMGKKGWEVVAEARIKSKPAFWTGKKSGNFKKC